MTLTQLTIIELIALRMQLDHIAIYVGSVRLTPNGGSPDVGRDDGEVVGNVTQATDRHYRILFHEILSWRVEEMKK